MTPASISTSTIARQDQLSRVALSQPGQPTRRGDSASTSRAPDSVNFSDAARQAAEDGRPVRLDLVTRVREQIAKGEYETPDKTAIAAHELTQALNQQG